MLRTHIPAASQTAVNLPVAVSVCTFRPGSCVKTQKVFPLGHTLSWKPLFFLVADFILVTIKMHPPQRMREICDHFLECEPPSYSFSQLLRYFPGMLLIIWNYFANFFVHCLSFPMGYMLYGGLILAYHCVPVYVDTRQLINTWMNEWISLLRISLKYIFY